MSHKQTSPFISLELEHGHFPPFDVGVIDGYQAHENFPNCCDFHTNAFNLAKEWFEKFPSCCKKHEDFMATFNYKKEQFGNVPKKILTQLSYTEYHISKRINTPTWYEDITSYIERNVWSFGRVGDDWYFHYLRHYIETVKPNHWTFPEEKRQKLLDYFGNETAQSEKPKKDTDLNLLYHTFQKWLATFPDLVFFNELKAKYTGKIPMNLFLYDPVCNPYMGWTKASIRTQSELLKLLVDFTKKILNEINTKALIESGTISNTDEHLVQLILETHKAKQDYLTGNFSGDEKQYRKILKEWLKKEKALFTELKPFFGKVPQLLVQPTQQHKSKQKPTTFLEYFRGSEARMERFFRALQELQALDKNFNWIMEGSQNTIVACFDALEQINHNSGNSIVKWQSCQFGCKRKLFDLIQSKIKTQISWDNFRKWQFDSNVRARFDKKFRQAYREEIK